MENGVVHRSVRLLLRVVGPVLLLLASSFSSADIVRDLHSAQVPVADQSSNALAAASRDALAEVLIKVSGSVAVLQNPALKNALAESRGNVQQYAYIRGESPEAELTARFEFDASYVTDLVTSAGAPLWTANRPLVLVWLVAEGAEGRYFVNWDSAPEQARQLLAEFHRRGVPVQLPLFDLVDTAAISPSQAWRLDATALRGASERYNVQNIVAGRLTELSAGGSVGDWSYFYDGKRLDRSVTAPQVREFIRNGVSLVAEEMAARYAVAAADNGQGGVNMSVVGVSSYADYAGIVAWLESLEVIEHANIERVQGDRIDLRLRAQADAGQLAAIIELNKRLLPIPDVTATGANDRLNYQWQN